MLPLFRSPALSRADAAIPLTCLVLLAQVQAANAAADRSASAQQLLQQKVRSADSAAMSSLWRQFRLCDREASGKLSSSEFAKALQTSKLGLSCAEVLQVASGLADCNGLLDYRPVTHLLQSQGLLLSARPQSASHAGLNNKTPPLARAGSHTAIPSRLSPARPSVKSPSGVGTAAAEHVDDACSPAQASPLSASSGVPGQGAAAQPKSLPAPAVQEQQPVGHSGGAASAAAAQQLSGRLLSSGSRAEAGNVHCSERPGSALAKRVLGPPAQKVPYFFSKGQVNMEQSYEWRPSQDNTAVHDVESKGHYERPWTAGVSGKKPVQASLMLLPLLLQVTIIVVMTCRIRCMLSSSVFRTCVVACIT